HRVDADLQAATRWHAQVRTVLDSGNEGMRWIPEEAVRNLEDSKPQLDPLAWPKGQQWASLDEALTDEERRALDFLDVDVRALVAETNESILRAELVERSHFFENVERTPLTEEQARAVVCFDNRVQVIAAAGSGKTSVMVARAAYAIKRGFVPPGRCLL